MLSPSDAVRAADAADKMDTSGGPALPTAGGKRGGSAVDKKETDGKVLWLACAMLLTHSHPVHRSRCAAARALLRRALLLGRRYGWPLGLAWLCLAWLGKGPLLGALRYFRFINTELANKLHRIPHQTPFTHPPKARRPQPAPPRFQHCMPMLALPRHALPHATPTPSLLSASAGP